MTELKAGELIQLIDQKERRYTMTLTADGEFQNHKGNLKHSDIIGLDEGSTVETSRGQSFKVFRPTLAEFVIGMPRGAQVIYPKDLGAILMFADIYPGCRVLETGVGSGALSMTLLRAGAKVTGVELREDFAGRAKANVHNFLGDKYSENYDVQIGSSYEGLPEIEVDRVLMDLPEPWMVVPHIDSVLRPGGLVLSYSPSTTQVSKATEALYEHGFSHIRTTEVLHREWYVKGEAVRPDHRMVAHTGFLTVARKS